MHKAKILMPLVAIALIIGLSGAAEAAISCNIASTPVSRSTSTGHTEPVGDLTFLCTGTAGATTTATVTIEYGLPITNNAAYPGGAALRISNPSGDFTAGNTTIASVSNSTGQVVLQVPAVAAPNGDSSFTLTGVLVSLSGASGSNLTANLSMSPGNQYFITANQNTATVVTNIRTALADPILTASGTATVQADGTVLDATLGFSVAELYIDMLRTQTQFSGGSTAATNETQILFTFAGIPSGLSITGCAPTLTATGQTGAPTLSRTTLTSTNNTTSLLFTSSTALNLTILDTAAINCTGITPGTGVPSSGTVTVQATLAPTGSALNSGAVHILSTTGQIPRYAANQQPATPLTVLTFAAARSDLLVPFAMSQGTIDTGIDIANITADPFTTGGANASTGAVTFSFYNNDGSAVSTYTTVSGSPGTGLTASTGNVASGSSYIVNLSELLPLATPAITGNFSGYIFVSTGFTNAHGAAFVVDWTGGTNFTSRADVLTLPPPGIGGNTRVPGTGIETTGH